MDGDRPPTNKRVSLVNLVECKKKIIKKHSLVKKNKKISNCHKDWCNILHETTCPHGPRPHH